jgi:hypothetical protein
MDSKREWNKESVLPSKYTIQWAEQSKHGVTLEEAAEYAVMLGVLGARGDDFGRGKRFLHINDAKVSLPPTSSLSLPPPPNVSASLSSSGSRDAPSRLEASGVAEPVPADPASDVSSAADSEAAACASGAGAAGGRER